MSVSMLKLDARKRITEICVRAALRRLQHEAEQNLKADSLDYEHNISDDETPADK